MSTLRTNALEGVDAKNSITIVQVQEYYHYECKRVCVNMVFGKIHNDSFNN